MNIKVKEAIKQLKVEKNQTSLGNVQVGVARGGKNDNI